jgi:hypothetical protein
VRRRRRVRLRRETEERQKEQEHETSKHPPQTRKLCALVHMCVLITQVRSWPWREGFRDNARASTALAPLFAVCAQLAS